MNAQTLVFLVLVINQLVAISTFVGVYGTRSGWRETPVGRHMMFWSVAAGVLDLSWVLLVVIQRPWLMYVLFTAQGLVGLFTWQRVVLVIRAQRQTKP